MKSNKLIKDVEYSNISPEAYEYGKEVTNMHNTKDHLFHCPQPRIHFLFFIFNCFILFPLASPAIGQGFDFDGQLKGITITDPDSGNIAPTAVFTYTQDGDTFNFDASESSDPDGSITEYRWDLGDGTTGTEATITNQFAIGSFPVTLTVVDNSGNVSITQILVETAIPNIIPDAGDIQAEGWSDNSVNRISPTTWTENGTYTWARLISPTFNLEIGSQYTLTFNYTSTAEMTLQLPGFVEGKITCGESAVQTACGATLEANELNGNITFLLEYGILSNHSANIYDLSLTKN